MPDQKKGLPVWVWILLAVPTSVFLLGMLSSLAMRAVTKYRGAQPTGASSQPAAWPNLPLSAIPPGGVLLAPPPALGPLAALQGEPADLSSVMGRARKLANAWQNEAALVGIEASGISGGYIQTREGGVAKLTFGPSSFNVSQPRGGVFIVSYDRSGLRGTPAKGALPRALPEPMCAPEFVYRRVVGSDQSATVMLRYGLDEGERPVWLASLASDAKAKPQAFDAHNCQAASPARR